MGCTHCGERPVSGTYMLGFARAGKELELDLCDDCLDELLGENDIQRLDT